jgi:hypothetical protein
MTEEEKNEREEAFNFGFKTESILDNPYPDNSDLSRWFVDGWVSKFQNL